MKQASYKKGFTLLDILLVSAIVSLLSSLFLFNMSEAKLKAQDANMQVETQQISTAVAMYKEDKGHPPLSSINSGSGTPGKMHSEADPTSDYVPSMQLLVSEGYITEVPKSPTGMSYSYGVSSDGTQAVFGARLHNKRKGSSSSSTPGRDMSQDSCVAIPSIDWIHSDFVNSFMAYPPPSEWCTSGENLCIKVYNWEQYLDIFEQYCFADINPLYQEGPYSDPNWVLPYDVKMGYCNEKMGGMNESNFGFSSYYGYGTVFLKKREATVSGGLCDGTSDSEFCACI